MTEDRNVSSNAPAKILYGVCGIGLGHVHRQLPILESYIERGSEICIFAYGSSLEYLQQRFGDHRSVHICEVAVPFYVGNAEGLDFEATATRQENGERDFLGINSRAMARATELIGKPDLVISDYEPVAAQYGYAYDAPVVTIDQQSKYLCRDDWSVLDGQSCRDEVMRLRMLFPKADARIATSFFRVPQREGNSYEVELHGPVIRQAVMDLADRKDEVEHNRLLAYISSQQPFGQPLEEVLEVFASKPEWNIDLYVPQGTAQSVSSVPSNIRLREHGDPGYLDSLARSAALVSTAGHTLLSEAMFLGKPVLAVPLPVYEQQMNAQVLAENGFGHSVKKLDAASLASFLEDIPRATEAIERDEAILLKTPGQESILRTLKVWDRTLELDYDAVREKAHPHDQTRDSARAR